MSNIEDHLAEFLKTAPAVLVPGGAKSETALSIEGIFTELSLPWKPEGDYWGIDSDVGFVTAGLSDDEEVLTFIQFINTWSGKPKKAASFLEALLKINSTSNGACFAIFGDRDEGEEEKIGIVARIAARSIDKEEIALALTSLFSMSKLFD